MRRGQTAVTTVERSAFAGFWFPPEAINPIDCDHGRLEARLRPMRGLKRLHCAAVIAAAHAFGQYLRRGFYELAIDAPPQLRLAMACAELALAL